MFEILERIKKNHPSKPSSPLCHILLQLDLPASDRLARSSLCDTFIAGHGRTEPFLLQMVVKTEGISVQSVAATTLKVDPRPISPTRALLASAAGAEFNRHSLHGLQDLWHQMYAEPYEQVPFQVIKISCVVLQILLEPLFSDMYH